MTQGIGRSKEIQNLRRQHGLKLLDEYPNTARKTLARMLHQQHPDLWLTVEHARDWVRARTGSMGGGHPTKRTKVTHPREKGKPGDPFGNIPDAIQDISETEPLIWGPERTLIISDVHVPYHDRDALLASLRYAKARNANGIVINGDLVDFYACSKWATDPTKRNLKREIELTREVLGTIREGFPDAQITFKLGNHEERWERYLWLKAPELVGLEFTEIGNIFHCDQYGIDVLNRMRHVRIAGLNVIHGHEFGHSIWNPVNAARGLFLRANATAMCGHFHQSSSHHEKNMNDKPIVCWTTGCLCDLKPYYRPYNNKWGHGFAFVERDGRDFHVDNKQVIDGRVV